MRSLYLDSHSTPVLPILPSFSYSPGRPTWQFPLLSSVTGNLHPISGFHYHTLHSFLTNTLYSHHGWKWSTKPDCTIFFFLGIHLEYTFLTAIAVRWAMDHGLFSSAMWYVSLPFLTHKVFVLPILIFSTPLATWSKCRKPRREWRRNRDPEWINGAQHPHHSSISPLPTEWLWIMTWVRNKMYWLSLWDLILFV